MITMPPPTEKTFINYTEGLWKPGSENKSEQDKEKLIGQVSGGGDDKRTPPSNPVANLEQRILLLAASDLKAGRRYIKGLERIEVKQAE